MHRLLFYNPHRRRHIVSYGVITFARDTGRYLVVRRRFSPHYLLFMSGTYRLANLPLYFHNMTAEELRLVRRMLYNNIGFAEMCHMILPANNVEYANLRFLRCQDEISRLLNHVQHTTDPRPEPEWLFPKGRLERGETPNQAARREFIEETGVQLTAADINLIDEDPITTTHLADNDFIYETQYFVAIVPEELYLPKTFSNFEISARAWRSREELQNILGTKQLLVLTEAQRKISRHSV